MPMQTQKLKPITDSQEEETVHLFDAEARKEEALCGAALIPRTLICGDNLHLRKENETMPRQTRIIMPVTDSQEEETMHLFDAEARKEEALCGAETSAADRISLQYYLEQRRYEIPVGTVCERCKPRTVAFAKCLRLELVAEGRTDEAQEYRRLADRLTKETRPNR